MNVWSNHAVHEYSMGAGNWALPEKRGGADILRELEALAQPQVHGENAVGEGWLLPADGRPRCAAPGCDAQRRLWKRSARPVIEGLWACGRSCGLRVVERLVQRQMAHAGAALPVQEHRHRIPLGLVLLHRGAITQEQLRRALEAQQEAGRERIGFWLQQVSGVSRECILQGLAAQWNRPVLSSVGLVSTTMALVAPPQLLDDMKLLHLRVAGARILYCGFEQTLDTAGVAAVERMSGLRVETGVVAEQEFRSGADRLRSAAAVSVKNVPLQSVSELPEKVIDALWQAQPVASRLVTVRGTWWLRMWLEPASVGAYGLLPATGEDVQDALFQR